MIVVRYKDGEIFTQPNAEYILPSEKTNSVTLMDIQHGIVGVINMDEVGGVFDTVERLQDTAEPKLDLISRCELFNRLATIPTPPEANEFKAEVYKIIQGMQTKTMRLIDADKLYDTIKADKNNDGYWIAIDDVLELIENQKIIVRVNFE